MQHSRKSKTRAEAMCRKRLKTKHIFGNNIFRTARIKCIFHNNNIRMSMPEMKQMIKEVQYKMLDDV